MARLFGTDGVRGVANRDLDAPLAYRLARALVAVTEARGAAPQARADGSGSGRPAALIGCDTRASSDLLVAGLAAGFCSAGWDAILLDVIPTPGVAFLARALGVPAAVVSASHNPPEDNGIKFLSPEGYKQPDAVEEAVEAAALAGEDPAPRPVGGGVGRVRRRPDLRERYLEFLVSQGPDLRGLHVVVDCAHGAATPLAPELFRRLGARVTVLHDAPDGTNVNVGCGSTHPAPLARAVRDAGADAGFAFDGDADRCIAVDARGETVDGDHVLLLAAAGRRRSGRLPGGAVVGTVMTNYGLDLALQPLGVRVVRTRVGDRYVLERMLQDGLVVGGEPSGHVILLDRGQTTGDGLLTAVEILRAMVESGRPLSELAAGLRKLPQVLINVPVADRDAAAAHPGVAEAVRRAEARLAGRGRVVLRPSGTEPLVRVMVEGEDEGLVRALAEEIAAAVRAAGTAPGAPAGATG